VSVSDGKTGGHLMTINGVFSGEGRCRNNPYCEANKDEGPIPAGEYLLGTKYVPERHRGDSGDYEWYLLYGRDGKGGYTGQHVPVRDPRTGKTVERGGMNLHTGSVSIGCITVPSDTSRAKFWDYPRSAQYNKLKQILDNTEPLIYKGQRFRGKLTVR
jgi:hypothetical protein